MDFRAPDRIEYWTALINDIADVRMYYYYLLLDMGIWSFLTCPIHETTIFDDRSMFSGIGVSNCKNRLKECFEISGNAEFTLIGIWPELEKWVSDDNNGRVKRMPVISNSTGKVVYEAEYRSGFPLMSVLFTVDNSGSNKHYKKVGYGTIKYLAKPHEAEQFYTIYDNESKKHFEGILYKLDDGNFRVYIDGK